jgi:hypothetical protein
VNISRCPVARHAWSRSRQHLQHCQAQSLAQSQTLRTQGSIPGSAKNIACQALKRRQSVERDSRDARPKCCYIYLVKSRIGTYLSCARPKEPLKEPGALGKAAWDKQTSVESIPETKDFKFCITCSQNIVAGTCLVAGPKQFSDVYPLWTWHLHQKDQAIHFFGFLEICQNLTVSYVAPHTWAYLSSPSLRLWDHSDTVLCMDATSVITVC